MVELHKGHSGKTIDFFVWLEQYKRGEVHSARKKHGFIFHVAYRNDLSKSMKQPTSKVITATPGYRSHNRVPCALYMRLQQLIVISASAVGDGAAFLCQD